MAGPHSSNPGGLRAKGNRPIDPGRMLETAEKLVPDGPGRPQQVALRRAVSAAYYAPFHCLACANADMLVGGVGANRSDKAWLQVYRALNHGQTRKCCEQINALGFPGGIIRFAKIFVELQEIRHDADYHPFVRFAKVEVLNNIAKARDAVQAFEAESDKDRRAFAVYVLFPLRK